MRRRTGLAAVLAAATIVVAALVLTGLPQMWSGTRPPGLSTEAAQTFTPLGSEAEPINVRLVATRDEIVAGLTRAGWNPADPATLRAALASGISAALRDSYAETPLSTLLHQGRRQDLAFERPFGEGNAGWHARLWSTGRDMTDGRPIWSVGVTAGRAAAGLRLAAMDGPPRRIDLDAGRNRLIADLEAVDAVAEASAIDGIGIVDAGRTGDGEVYFTDGRATRAVLRATAPN